MEYGRLIDFISHENLSKSKYLDLLEFYYPYMVYLYGNQFKVNKESIFSTYKEKIKNDIRELYCIKQILIKSNARKKDEVNILSGAYFGINKYLDELGYNTIYGPWLVNGTDKFLGNIKYIHDYYSFKRKITGFKFQDLISEKCDTIVGDFIGKTRKVMRDNKIKAFIASSTHAMENRIPLQAAKEEGIPTFVFLHGLPFPFYYEEPERADYLIVWSEKIKENFIKLTNFPEKRIFVAGHPFYQEMTYNKLRNSLDDILIISPSSEAERNQDRGNMIYYLMAIEKVLRQFGVKNVRFRPHPHEHTDWYLKFVNKNFFIPDTRPLNKALELSTLVIGTLSTIVVEAIYYGVNYILFDPLDTNKKNVYGHITVPPFDGSDALLPVAHSLKELCEFISNSTCVDINFFHEYIKTPFDISFIKDLI